jgi:hypothetical protein
MINQNPKNIIFRFNGSDARTLRCNWVKFGMEINGEIDELLDHELYENWEDGDIRLRISLEIMLYLSDALWMQVFIIARDKVIIIDGNAFEIVNSFRKIDFDLWKNSNAGVELEMKFKCRTTGIPEWNYS